jgi:3-oxoacyl-[acyl-carrier protein] reductase
MIFDNKIALITGASRGIGKAIALELSSQGAYVVVNYHRSVSAAEEVANNIVNSGGKCKLTRFDVSDFARVQEEIDKVVEELGGLHILVNNAGIAKDGLLLRMKENDWDEVLSVNLKGVFNCTKVASKIMVKQRYGRIINITSIVGEMGNAGQTNYSASKAGIIGLTKSTAKELGSRNITVNAISPGFIETDITQDLSQKIKDAYIEAIPLGRFGKPHDVAKAVMFLASDDASYITGEVIRVNGGLYT